jgi:6-phospho-3-hexuloisomerase
VTDDPLDELGGVLNVSLAKQHAYAASALALLRQGPDATAEATHALELYPAAPPEQRQPVNEAYAHVDIAYARLLSGEIDGVGEALVPVLNLPCTHALICSMRSCVDYIDNCQRASASIWRRQRTARADRRLRGHLESRSVAMTEPPEPIFAQQLAELHDVLARISREEFVGAAQLVVATPMVHLTGRGRNELALRAFGNRLMQLGKPVAILGDILSAPVRHGDLVVIASGSGTTSALLDVADASLALNAKILALTGQSDSPLSERASVTLTIPPLLTDGSKGVQPLGTLFEQCLGLVCDALVIDLMHRLDVTIDAMRTRHANIE